MQRRARGKAADLVDSPVGGNLDSPGSEFGASHVGKLRVISGLIREFGLFLKEDRTWWLAPILVVLGALGAFTVFVQGSALAPLIYALF